MHKLHSARALKTKRPECATGMRFLHPDGVSHVRAKSVVQSLVLSTETSRDNTGFGFSFVFFCESQGFGLRA